MQLRLKRIMVCSNVQFPFAINFGDAISYFCFYIFSLQFAFTFYISYIKNDFKIFNIHNWMQQDGLNSLQYVYGNRIRIKKSRA